MSNSLGLSAVAPGSKVLQLSSSSTLVRVLRPKSPGFLQFSVMSAENVVPHDCKVLAVFTLIDRLASLFLWCLVSRGHHVLPRQKSRPPPLPANRRKHPRA